METVSIPATLEEDIGLPLILVEKKGFCSKMLNLFSGMKGRGDQEIGNLI